MHYSSKYLQGILLKEANGTAIPCLAVSQGDKSARGWSSVQWEFSQGGSGGSYWGSQTVLGTGHALHAQGSTSPHEWSRWALFFKPRLSPALFRRWGSSRESSQAARWGHLYARQQGCREASTVTARALRKRREEMEPHAFVNCDSVNCTKCLCDCRQFMPVRLEIKRRTGWQSQSAACKKLPLRG